MVNYDEANSTLFLFGPIDTESAGAFTEAAYNFLNSTVNIEECDPFTVVISTTGGCVTSGIAIIDVIGKLKEVTTVIMEAYGQVSSMGFNIFLEGDVRLMGPNTCFLYHGISGVDSMTNVSARRSVEWWGSVETRLDKLIVERTTFTMEELASYQSETDGVWFTAEEIALRLK